MERVLYRKKTLLLQDEGLGLQTVKSSDSNGEGHSCDGSNQDASSPLLL